ncbi:MAG: endolytic transglycosylase MltG [Legionella sp.]|uniref:endolytic transglycosylase MltG n=1 Tax=Legionella sp. TaxID=459 RepID=UPI00284ABA6A|nr:endolytic transglycosylase MltG [Legionella sp.]
MIKKLLIIAVLCLIILGGFSLYQAFLYRRDTRNQRLNAKAPQTSITLVEGWTNRQIADYLQNKGIISSSVFLADTKDFDVSDYPILKSKPAGQSLEGFIFPDTYFIPQTGQNIGQIIIQKALDNFSKKISPQMQAKAAASGQNLYQIITLASIVEKEAGRDQDKPAIAGVFYNRLKSNMALQSDATVAYSQLENLPEYNTYNNTGLPPGPISNPSLTSIQAALNPESTDYFYFLTDPKTGQAIFARTYDEHLKNKAEYLK